MKTQRTLSNNWKILMMTFLLIVGGAARAAAHPPQPADGAALMAARLCEATGALCRAAHEGCCKPNAAEAEALARVDRLDRAALRFHLATVGHGGGCEDPGKACAVVRAAFGQAQPLLPAIITNQEVQLAALRTRNTIRDLCEGCAAPGAAVVLDYGTMRGLAEQISEAATQLEDRAREERKMACVTPEQFEFIERLNTAAKSFYVQVVSARNKPAGCAGEYAELQDRMIAARGVVAAFSPDFQRYFRALWELTAQLHVVPAPVHGRDGWHPKGGCPWDEGRCEKGRSDGKHGDGDHGKKDGHEGWRKDGGHKDGCRCEDGRCREKGHREGMRKEEHGWDGPKPEKHKPEMHKPDMHHPEGPWHGNGVPLKPMNYQKEASIAMR